MSTFMTWACVMFGALHGSHGLYINLVFGRRSECFGVLPLHFDFVALGHLPRLPLCERPSSGVKDGMESRRMGGKRRAQEVANRLQSAVWSNVAVWNTHASARTHELLPGARAVGHACSRQGVQGHAPPILGMRRSSS